MYKCIVYVLFVKLLYKLIIINKIVCTNLLWNYFKNTINIIIYL